MSVEKQLGTAEVPSHRNRRMGTFTKERGWAGFPGGPVLRTPRFHCGEPGIQSLVGELRSRKPQGAAGKKKKGAGKGGTGVGDIIPELKHFRSVFQSCTDEAKEAFVRFGKRLLPPVSAPPSSLVLGQPSFR